MPTVMDLWNPQNPPRIAHVGAHLGEERDAYEAAGAAVVWWHEGNPSLLDPLRAHLCEPRPMTATQHQVIGAVLGRRDEEPVVLNIAADTMNSSVLDPGEIPVEYVGRCSTLARTIDALHADLGQPTMLAIDSQGYELEILKGAGAALPGVELVYCEVSEVPIYDGAPHWSEIDHLLREAGFRLAQIEMSRNGEGWGDGCWLRVGCG